MSSRTNNKKRKRKINLSKRGKQMIAARHHNALRKQRAILDFELTLHDAMDNFKSKNEPKIKLSRSDKMSALIAIINRYFNGR